MISSGLFDSGIADSTKSYHQSRVGRYGPSSEGGPSFADLPALCEYKRYLNGGDLIALHAPNRPALALPLEFWRFGVLPSDPFRAWLRNPIACNNNSWQTASYIASQDYASAIHQVLLFKFCIGEESCTRRPNLKITYGAKDPSIANLSF